MPDLAPLTPTSTCSAESLTRAASSSATQEDVRSAMDYVSSLKKECSTAREHLGWWQLRDRHYFQKQIKALGRLEESLKKVKVQEGEGSKSIQQQVTKAYNQCCQDATERAQQFNFGGSVLKKGGQGRMVLDALAPHCTPEVQANYYAVAAAKTSDHKASATLFYHAYKAAQKCKSHHTTAYLLKSARECLLADNTEQCNTHLDQAIEEDARPWEVKQAFGDCYHSHSLRNRLSHRYLAVAREHLDDARKIIMGGEASTLSDSSNKIEQAKQKAQLAYKLAVRAPYGVGCHHRSGMQRGSLMFQAGALVSQCRELLRNRCDTDQGSLAKGETLRTEGETLGAEGETRGHFA